ncbi:hypothetical protein JX266_011058 [Neoarthrinium moseri]|nr:hypothetical protein JX266_011058 [Neoarthrinium moseri]
MGALDPILGELSISHAFWGVIVSSTFTFLMKLYAARRRFLRLKERNLPMPPWSPLFGHLLYVASIMSNLPRDCHPHYMAGEIRRAMPELGPLFYLDLWPFGPQMLIVSSPDAAYQITQKHSLPKYHALRRFLYPLTHGFDLLTMEGNYWKEWRAIFSPGFNGSHLMTLVPGLVEDTEAFCDILHERARKGVLAPLHEATTNLAMDVIGRVALDTQLNTQRGQNPLAKALRNQIPWLNFGNDMDLLARFNPFRPLICWRNKRTMDQYLARELDTRYRTKSMTLVNGAERGRSITDLAIDTYLNRSTGTQRLDETFMKFAINQIILFMFAGHDTTSSTICYSLYLLSTHPLALAELRKEHDKVLGTNTSETATLLRQSPYLLNQLPYTLAVIKETLRLFPAASSTRSGERGTHVLAGGQRFPTEGFMVWSLHQALHRDPALWNMPDAFRPERWLPDRADKLNRPLRDAWRPFEFGPRNCLGQELAVLEIKVVLVMLVRTFNVIVAYEEWDRLQGHHDGKPHNMTVAGERAYQVGMQHPSEGFPCRVQVLTS